MEGIDLIPPDCLNENEFQCEQNGKDIHCRSDFLELTADHVHQHIRNHSNKDTVGDRVGKRHHDATVESE